MYNDNNTTPSWEQSQAFRWADSILFGYLDFAASRMRAMNTTADYAERSLNEIAQQHMSDPGEASIISDWRDKVQEYADNSIKDLMKNWPE